MVTLLDLGAPLMREDKQGNTAPYHAAAAGQTEALRLLLQRGADVRSRPASGRTAMHAAASTGQLEMMAMLREAGADPNGQDEQGRTPLHWAAEKGQVCVCGCVCGCVRVCSQPTDQLLSSSGALPARVSPLDCPCGVSQRERLLRGATRQGCRACTLDVEPPFAECEEPRQRSRTVLRPRQTWNPRVSNAAALGGGEGAGKEQEPRRHPYC